MMTESYAETVRANTGSPYGYPALTAELVLSHFEPAAAHETGTVISNLPTDGETVTAAMSAGFACACWSGGSGSAGTINVDKVDGADVVLFPDNDHDGIRAMRAIGNRLDGVARSVRVADLAGMPDRADIADIAPEDARRRIATSRGFAHFLRATGGPIREKGARQPVRLSAELRRLAHVRDFASESHLAGFTSSPAFNESGFAHLVLENQAEKLLAVTGNEGVEFLALRRHGTWSRDAEDLRRLISSVGKHYLRRMVNCSDQPPYDDDRTFFPAVRALRAVEQGQSIAGVPAAMRLAFQEKRRMKKTAEEPARL